MLRAALAFLSAAFACSVLGSGCFGPANSKSTPITATKPAAHSRAITTIFVLGTIHGEHKTSKRYSVSILKQILRAYDPDFLLTEIPPDRWPTALAQHRDGQPITEPRIARFPEYTDAFVGLLDELNIELIPCAAWTQTMATKRAAKLSEWKTTRPQDSAVVDASFAEIETAIASLGSADDPLIIHSDAYDKAVRDGMSVYDRIFGADLGPGGWTAINLAHFALIEAALNRIPQGSRVLISFGAWHKYWFVEKLAERNDVRVVELTAFWTPSGRSVL